MYLSSPSLRSTWKVDKFAFWIHYIIFDQRVEMLHIVVDRTPTDTIFFFFSFDIDIWGAKLPIIAVSADKWTPNVRCKADLAVPVSRH